MPETNVTTAITAATPITTPSSVSTERSLLAQSERSAMRMDSRICMNQVREPGEQLGSRGGNTAFAPLTVYRDFRQNDEFTGTQRLWELPSGARADSAIINP